MPGPIEQVVIIVKENHSFDNYFGTFPGADGHQLAQAQNPPPDDPNHRHEAWMARAGDTAHMVQYLSTDIPGYFDYAQRYTLCDEYFSEVAGPSTPNHLMLICADAPIINNPRHHYRPRPGDGYDLSSLPLALENAGHSWGELRRLRLPLHQRAGGSPGQPLPRPLRPPCAERRLADRVVGLR
jgi:phospholipase C